MRPFIGLAYQFYRRLQYKIPFPNIAHSIKHYEHVRGIAMKVGFFPLPLFSLILGVSSEPDCPVEERDHALTDDGVCVRMARKSMRVIDVR